jgi:CRISPR system Cascade subunit CasB
MTHQTPIEKRSGRLLEHLKRLRDDRGAMANLRRGFSPATEHRAWPWVAQWCDLNDDRLRAIVTSVAAAFATHPELATEGNLGLTMREIAHGRDGGEKALESFEPRFRRFLTCQLSADVCQRLPGVIRAAAQRGVGINYRQLFIDLCYWGDRVKLRWAEAFWGQPPQGETT